MKWSFLRDSRTAGERSGSRMHSRQRVQSRRRSEDTTARPRPGPSSMSKQRMGHLATSRSASSPSTGCRRSMRGSSRYQAVATGDHLACPRSPRLLPLCTCISMSISCPGRSRAMRMSPWTGTGGSQANVSACLPKGIHSSCDENTRALTASSREPPGVLRHLTCRRNLSTSSSGTSPVSSTALVCADGHLKREGSALIGMRPRRWAISSSLITPVLFRINTFSTAIVGTSERSILRKAFASETSIPLKSNVISSSATSRILICSPFLHFSMSKGSSSMNVPRQYVVVCSGARPWQMT
mmetsp:Transcript_40906/g.109446  ORF Transcript_40906/g.109446 Transcript_40906/m.109446 type:complete len:298 (-) Transcript_40906:24-917(-)